MNLRFAHISDLHLPPLPAVSLSGILNKRLLGYLSWHRKRKHLHLTEVVAALEKDLFELAADHICITGDITNLGLAPEFVAAGRWLDKLAPRTVTFVPGNHDAYVSASIKAMDECFGDWLPETFPFIDRRDDITFIGLSTAVATPPLSAAGRVGRQQLTRLEWLLDRHAGDAFKVLLIHHPPAPGVVKRRKALTDSKALNRVLNQRRVDLVLHGHGHRATQYLLESKAGPVPVFGAGSASMSHPDAARTGHYHVFDFNDEALTVSHRRYRPEQGCFAAAGEVRLPRR